MAAQIFFEENPEATTNPEEYELRAPEGHYYLLARSRAMSGIRGDLLKYYRDLMAEAEKTEDELAVLGEKVGAETDEELERKVTKLENNLASTESKLKKANRKAEEAEAEKARLDYLLSKQQKTEAREAPDYGNLKRREEVEEEEPTPEEIAEEKQEHPQLTVKQASQIVKDHKKAKKPYTKTKHRTDWGLPTMPKVPPIREIAPTGKSTGPLGQGGVPRAESLAQLSAAITTKSMDIVITLIRAGEANLMEGYTASIIVADLMHSAGLLSQKAYDAVFTLDTIMAAIASAEGLATIVTSIFGAESPFQPQLKSRVEQTTNERGETTTKKTAEGAGKAAQQLAGLIPELTVAAL